MIWRPILAAMMLLIPSLVLAQPAEKGDLTLQARSILRKYCAECHHADPNRLGEISVLDRAGLERAERPFLAPRADASQLVGLIEDGSMPPGNRPKPTEDERRVIREWVNAGAADYPRQFDEAYVRRMILDDVRKLPAAERASVRYFSLHRVIPDLDPTFRLAPKRQALIEAIQSLSKEGAAAGEAVDPVGAVIRVDLRRTGWDAKPFSVRKLQPGGRRVTEKSDVNLFDVILIEYPHGRLDPADTELIELFLKPAAQAMPVAYLHADWFADEFARSAVAAELRTFLNRPAPAAFPLVGPAVAMQTEAKGTPILPLDAVSVPNIIPDPPPFILTFETHDADAKVPKDRFTEGDKMRFFIRPTKTVWIEIVQTDSSGKRSVLNLGAHNLVSANEGKLLGSAKGEAYTLGFSGGDGKESFTIYASEVEFPPGVAQKTTEHLNERVIHNFYPLPGSGTKLELNPAKIVKKTIRIEMRPKPTK